MGKRTSPPQDVWFGQPELSKGKLSINEASGFGVTANEAML